jgi:hypothetical protein
MILKDTNTFICVMITISIYSKLPVIEYPSIQQKLQRENAIFIKLLQKQCWDACMFTCHMVVLPAAWISDPIIVYLKSFTHQTTMSSKKMPIQELQQKHAALNLKQKYQKIGKGWKMCSSFPYAINTPNSPYVR